MIPLRFLRCCPAAVLAITLPLLLTGCGDTHDKAMSDMISTMNRMADSLGAVKDKAGAEAAKAKLEKIREELKAVKERMKNLGDPTDEVARKLKDKYEKELEAAALKMQGALAAVAAAGPEAEAVLKDIVGNVREPGKSGQ